jgi:hypothetical protein
VAHPQTAFTAEKMDATLRRGLGHFAAPGMHFAANRLFECFRQTIISINSINNKVFMKLLERYW